MTGRSVQEDSFCLWGCSSCSIDFPGLSLPGRDASGAISGQSINILGHLLGSQHHHGLALWEHTQANSLVLLINNPDVRDHLANHQYAGEGWFLRTWK